MSDPTEATGAPDAPTFKHKTLKAKIFDLLTTEGGGMHEVLERLADISYEQQRIHECDRWSEIVKHLEQAQRLAETAAPVA